jgi:hypothetical protein
LLPPGWCAGLLQTSLLVLISYGWTVTSGSLGQVAFTGLGGLGPGGVLLGVVSGHPPFLSFRPFFDRHGQAKTTMMCVCVCVRACARARVQYAAKLLIMLGSFLGLFHSAKDGHNLYHDYETYAGHVVAALHIVVWVLFINGVQGQIGAAHCLRWGRFASNAPPFVHLWVSYVRAAAPASVG